MNSLKTGKLGCMWETICHKRWILLLLCLVMLTSCGMPSAEKKTESDTATSTESNTENNPESNTENGTENSTESNTENGTGSNTESNTENNPESNTGEVRVRQLLMIYMVGSDLESETGMASRDLTEILESDFEEENLEVLICTGGTEYWWTEGISGEVCEIFEVTEGSLKQVYTMEHSNMAEADTLTEFVDYGYANSTADDYSLIMWNHGGGAVLGFGADEKYDYDTLSMEELDRAFRGTKLIAEGKRFTWIGFDACLMAMLEVADTLSDYTDYLIASEETEAGEGWDYSFLKTISAGEYADGPAAAEEIVRAYSNYYETNYQHTPDYILACLDLARTQEVIDGLEGLIEVAAEELQAGGYSKIARMRDQAKTFGKVSSQGFYDTVDLYDLSMKMSTVYPVQANALQTAVDEMIVYRETNVHGAYGVSVFFPYENKEYTQDWLKEYEKTGFSESYIAFLKSFTDTLSGKQLAEWDIARVTPREDTEAAGEYYVQLTEEQYANFSHAQYTIWSEDMPGQYICWINSLDVTVSEEGKVRSGFSGKYFWLGDTSGALMPCCAVELERNESYVKYAIPVLITPVKEDGGFSMEPGYIHVRVDCEHPEGEMIGIYKEMDADSSLFPNRNLMEVKEGDIITPFYFAREIGFYEDGSVKPFEEWGRASGINDSFAVNGELTITLRDAEEGVEYCCLFGVTDTQGNSYYTDPIYIQY